MDAHLGDIKGGMFADFERIAKTTRKCSNIGSATTTGLRSDHA
jgi:hypothetical protein